MTFRPTEDIFKMVRTTDIRKRAEVDPERNFYALFYTSCRKYYRPGQLLQAQGSSGPTASSPSQPRPVDKRFGAPDQAHMQGRVRAYGLARVSAVEREHCGTRALRRLRANP